MAINTEAVGSKSKTHESVYLFTGESQGKKIQFTRAAADSELGELVKLDNLHFYRSVRTIIEVVEELSEEQWRLAFLQEQAKD